MLKNTVILIIVLAFNFLGAGNATGQFATPDYSETLKPANALFRQKKYKEAAIAFSEAFAKCGNVGSADDRFKAAGSWAMAGNADSAFIQLKKLADSGLFYGQKGKIDDKRLASLHSDSRWAAIVDGIYRNYENRPQLNKPLAQELNKILAEDYGMRNKIHRMMKKYGYDSPRVKEYWKEVSARDSVHLVAVKKIIEEHGWLGWNEVGRKGYEALFLVIQHSDTATQRKYLPVLRQAVKDHNALPADLALLEDRVLIGLGKKQIYGSQLETDPATGKYFVSPLEDPEHVDERRRKIGLSTMAEHLSFWHLEWDVEAYKEFLKGLDADR
ncbi:MAG: hypothetical protein GC178_14170 [Flavobacteriales bacterium]|nr:hypothetical protein [Flavobacteriales bacterium]